MYESQATDLQIIGEGLPFPFASKVWELQNINNTNKFSKVILASNSGSLAYVVWHLGDITYSPELSFTAMDTGKM